MKTRIIIWVASLVLTGTLNVVAEEMSDPAAVSKRADIKRLMEVTDVSSLGMQIMNQMIVTMNQGRSEAHKKFWTDYMAEADPNDLIEMIIPIYERHFTHEEIRSSPKSSVKRKLREIGVSDFVSNTSCPDSVCR